VVDGYAVTSEHGLRVTHDGTRGTVRVADQVDLLDLSAEIEVDRGMAHVADPAEFIL
jgi:hypothetical protein